MKLFKKTAALFFCMALAVSVMAVSALADDEAVLLAGLAEPQPNAMFEVTLVKASAATDTALDAAKTDNILDRDTVNGYEVKETESVTFNIMLAYKGSSLTGKKIDGFQFTFVPGAAAANDTDNKGVTISGFTLGSHDAYAVRSVDANSDYVNVYASGSLGGGNDIDIPGTTATKIGTITFSFDNALQNNNALQPTIKTMLIQVRGMQHPQWIVKAPEDNTSEYPYGEDVYVTSGDPGTGYSYPTPAAGSSAVSNSNDYVDGTATTDKPIYVNPFYTAKVEHFQANATTGIAEKITTGTGATTTVTYYFDSEKVPSTGGPYNTLTNEARIPGYTFKGWMVTVNGNGQSGSPTSNTWAAYVDNTDGTWDKATSYKETVTNIPTGADAKGWTAWTDPSNGFYNLTSRANALTSNPDGTTAQGVKFIPVNTENNATTTAIPSGYVGDLTLTPIYTRDAYTVTFNADDFTTNTTSKAFFSSDTVISQTEASRQRTDYYTIEDLVDTTANPVAPADYLSLKYGDSMPYVTGANAGLKKPGYKFVGWVPTLPQSDVVEADKAAYQWTKPATTRVNSTSVIHAAQMKRYGDLTLTAEWELDIYFAKVEYWYAGQNAALILVAVPSGNGSNYEQYYTYKCKSDNNADEAMFIIPADKQQRAAYMNAAFTAQTTQVAQESPAPANETYTITSALFNAESGTYKDSYVLYAYIAADTTKELNITLDETTTTTEACGNTSIAYDGDVDGSAFVSVADFGNVDTLLGDYTATGIFAITDRAGVEARLEADYTTGVDTTDSTILGGETDRKFASIADVKGIYNVMGYNAT